ncbi:MAG: type II toxin-antitoxin system HicB family antitoxin [Coriobacteriales bacterium]|jgi:predicted RNase H-like HicB family nuclease|nr:type II toxin-antitoxin system HicB family antitoxin [Coriobacteriales bacterium]
MKIDRDVISKYTYRVEWSEEDQTHLARCLEFPSLAVHGSTPIKALSEIESVVDAALRIPSELHRRLVISSAEEGVSLNQYILAKIS